MSSIKQKINKICSEVKIASIELANTTVSERNKALTLIAKNITKYQNDILECNKKDYSLAKKNKTPSLNIECMTTAAACRTFNILASEGRKVVAAILISGENLI